MINEPLVSTIIIFLNTERFLEEAIESVFSQSYQTWELLLCDDGSTDGSTEIARRYVTQFPDKVRYHTHEGNRNLGMSATRNLGLRHARGELIAWLDGDDVWTSRKLERQVEIIRAHPEVAMVYGRLRIWYGWTGKSEDVRRDIIQDLGVSADTIIQPPQLLTRFLLDDMHTPSGVLVRRAVLEEVGGYEETFRGMHEDGIVHAKICLKWPVFAAGECWYMYRQHKESCCQTSIKAQTDRTALTHYLNWLENYLREQHQDNGDVWQVVQRLSRANRDSFGNAFLDRAKGMIHRGLSLVKKVADRIVPSFIRRSVGLLVYGKNNSPPSGWLHFGNLRRMNPVSRVFGWDRGVPIDRYYIEKFLESYASEIQGRVLEIGDQEYTCKFGGDRVTKSDILHVRPGNPQTTLVGDLCTGEGIPENVFDCMILTQTFPFLWDFKVAISNAARALKPGGVMLVTLPGISQISRFDADRWGDFWRFTSMSTKRLFEEEFPTENLKIAVYGNVLAATAFLHGLATQELRPSELDYCDPDYEMIITVHAVKPKRSEINY